MGCSCAFHLIRKDPTLKIAVFEMDPTYTHSSTTLSLANVRVQFSLEENIKISCYTLKVLKDFHKKMAVDGSDSRVFFRQEGNLFMVEKSHKEQMKKVLERQLKLGGEVEWWPPTRIREEFPEFNVSRFAGGTFGIRDGHLDAYAFLKAYRNKAKSLGVTFRTAEVSRVLTAPTAATGIQLRCGTSLYGKYVLNCAGAWAAHIAQTAGIELPVLPVRRQVFVAAVKQNRISPLPLTNLPSGLYFRSEGTGQILVGKSMEDDSTGFDFSVDEIRFNQQLWPELVQFVPTFDRLKLLRGWSGLYAENSFDGNALLGEWPGLEGFFLVNGFSGHGMQQAPAIGRYISEILLHKSPCLDLSIFSPKRLFTQQSIIEDHLI